MKCNDNHRSSRPPFRRSVAIVVGVNAYASGIPTLRTAVNDARALASVLSDQHDYGVELLCDQHVTYAAVRDRIAEFGTSCSSEDRLFFYFAGHGVALDGDDGPQGFLLTQDADHTNVDSFLPMTDLNRWLDSLACRHTLVVLDCCFSGAFRWSGTRDVYPLPEVIYRERYDRYVRDPAWQVITSAAHDQKAQDVIQGEPLGRRGETRRHSPFARALLDGLTGSADLVPKDGGDGVITATELYLYLRQRVEPDGNTRQTPGLWPLKRHDKGEFIFLVPDHPLNLPPAPELSKTNNPWRGLEAYRETDDDIFFGRGPLSEELLARIERDAIIVVVGPSGSGKSSLVSAGLLPRLRSRRDTHTILPTLRLGETPVADLTRALRKALQDPQGSAGPDSGDETPAEWIERFLERDKDQTLVLFIDQFEELVTLCSDTDERKRFVVELKRMLAVNDSRLRVIVTVRSDFEPHFAELLNPLWQSSRFLVPPMSQNELREIIEGPAAARVIYFEPYDLVERLINEVVQSPGALSLLSFALSEMYLSYLDRQSDNRSITLEDYEKIGSAVGALRNKASQVHAELNPEQRKTLRRVMLRMVSLERGELARRRVSQSELTFDDDEENLRVGAVLDSLVSNRLVVVDEVLNEAYFEPAHEELIRGWDLLLEWLDSPGTREQSLYQRRLHTAASGWTALRRLQKDATEALWSKTGQVLRLREFLDDAPEELNATERQFAVASIALHSKSRRTKTAVAAGMFVVVSIIGTIAGVLGWREKIATDLATERLIVSELSNAAYERDENQDSLKAAHLYARAARLDTHPARAMASATAVDHELKGTALIAITHDRPVVSPNGRRLLLIASGSAEMIDGDTGMAMDTPLGRATVYRPEFSPDGALVVTRNGDTVQLWNSDTGAPLHVPVTHEDLRDVYLSSTGTLLVTTAYGSGDDPERGPAQLWDSSSGRRIGEPFELVEPSKVVFDPYEKWLVARSGAAQPTLLRAEAPTSTALAHDGAVDVVALSNDRVVTYDGRQARIWSSVNGQQVGTDIDATRAPIATPDLNRFLIADDHSITLWDPAIGMSVGTIKHSGRSYPWFGPAGRLLLTSQGDRVVVSNASDLRTIIDRQPKPGSGSEWLDESNISPDGNWIAFAEYNFVQLYDSAGLQRQQIDFRGWPSILMGPGNRLFLYSRNSPGQLWNMDTQTPTGREISHLDSQAQHFSPDGKKLLTWSYGGVAKVWSSTTGVETSIELVHEDLAGAEFLSNSVVLTSGHNEGTAESGIRLWRTGTAGASYRFPGKPAADEKAFGIREGSGDELVAVDLATGQDIDTFRIPFAAQNDIILSPGGRHALTLQKQRAAFLTNPSTADRPFHLPHDNLHGAIASRQTGRVITWDGTKAVVWNAHSGARVAEMPHEDDSVGPTVTADGSTVLTWSQDQAVLWQVDTGARNGDGFPHVGARYQRLPLIDAHGKKLLTRVGRPQLALVLWDTASGSPIGEPITERGNGAPDAAFSPDGQRFVLWEYRDGARLWDSDTARQIGGTMPHEHFKPPEFRRNGTRLITRPDDSHVQLWNSLNGAQLGSPIPVRGRAELAFSADETLMLTKSEQDNLTVWNIEDGRAVQTRFGFRPIRSAAVSPDSQRLLTVDDRGSVATWVVETGEQDYSVSFSQPYAARAAYSPDGQHALTYSFDTDSWTVWERKTGAAIRSMELAALFSTGATILPIDRVFAAVKHVAFAGDGGHIVVVVDDGRSFLQNIQTGETTALISDQYVESPDRNIAAWGYGAGTQIVRRYDAQDSADDVYYPYPATVEMADPDTGLVVARIDRAALWQSSGDEPVATFYLTPEGRPVFSPDGEQVFLQLWDGTGQIRHTDTAKVAFTVGETSRARFNATGTRVITLGRDGNHTLWDATIGHFDDVLLYLGLQHNRIDFSVSGNRIGAWDNGQVFVWDHTTVGLPDWLTEGDPPQDAGPDLDSADIDNGDLDAANEVEVIAVASVSPEPQEPDPEDIFYFSPDLDEILAAEFVNDHDHLAVWSAEAFEVWDVGAEKRIGGGAIRQSGGDYIQWNTQGTQLLATADTGQTWLIDRSGEQVGSFAGVEVRDDRSTVVFGNDGDCIVSWARDRSGADDSDANYHTVTIRDVVTTQPVARLDFHTDILDIDAFDSCGRLVVYATDGAHVIDRTRTKTTPVTAPLDVAARTGTCLTSRYDVVLLRRQEWATLMASQPDELTAVCDFLSARRQSPDDGRNDLDAN